MADIAIDASADPDGDLPRGGSTAFLLVDVSVTNIYAFYIDGSGDFVYSKSTDGGSSWGAAVSIATAAAANPQQPAVWYDRWTTGDTGTKIHLAYGDTVNERILYKSLDTASDTLSTLAIAEDIADIGGDNSNHTKIAKSRGGNLYIAWSGFAGAFVGNFLRSIDGGVNWTTRTTCWESQDQDGPFSQLLPANLADNQDMWLVFGDQSANEISLKTYDDSANSWAETSITTAVTLGTNDVRQTAAAIRISDGHLILAINSAVDNAAADLLVYDITDSGTITAKTNIITNADDWTGVSVYINQASGVIYIGWLGNPAGSDTWPTSITIWKAVSVDGGATWQTSAQYSENAAGRNMSIWSSHGTPGSSPGKWLLMWFDDTNDDYLTNINNGVLTSPIAFDATSNSGYQATASTYNWSHVCLGNSRYLRVGVSMLSVIGSFVTSITYNGVALTFIGAVASVSGAVRSEIWGLAAPATGSNTIAVTLSTGLISAAGAISFVGVNQTLSTEGFNSATATNVGAADATVNVTTVADYDVVTDNVATDDTAIAVGAGQTSYYNLTGAGGSGAGSTEGPTTPAGSVTMSWTAVGALATWSTVAVALRDINAPGGVKQLAAMGVG